MEKIQERPGEEKQIAEAKIICSKLAPRVATSKKKEGKRRKGEVRFR
jgi:hypothetical protein